MNDRATIAPDAGSLFFPLDKRMKVGTEGYSPKLLEKIEYAGANSVSFKKAAQDLHQLSEVDISDKHIQRLTERLGAERQALRDKEVKLMEQDKLKPTCLNRPSVATVHLDGGRVQTRAEDDGKGPGVRGEGWNEVKVGCFLSYQDQGVVHDTDPDPEPPKKLLERETVKRLCQEMACIRTKSNQPSSRKHQESNGEQKESEPNQRTKLEPLVRTAVATTQDAEAFGSMVSAEAVKRRFYDAVKRAVLGDGGKWIWSIADFHFDGFTQILDFLHLLTYLYGAAQAAYDRESKKAWAFYTKLLTHAWKGNTGSLAKALEHACKRKGKPPKNASDQDPRKILASALTYVKNNAPRMDYPTYRKEGLPISSAPVESLVKQFNQRIKGTEKFWQRSRVEAVLQSRAAYLSQDRRLQEFWSKRKSLGQAVGQKRVGRTPVP